VAEVRRTAEPEIKSAEAKLADLKRMRVIAVSLLAVMTCIFVATSVATVNWPWLPYARAFAEAGMVGACADWFAVVALFRHPFGIPIPHTGIVPNNKDRIGAALGRFITNNFLSPRVAHEQLFRVDVVGWITRWLNDPDNAKQLAQYVGTLLPRILKSLAPPELGEFFGNVARQGIESIPAAPLASSSWRCCGLAARRKPRSSARSTWANARSGATRRRSTGSCRSTRRAGYPDGSTA
jgi:uncharacterized membrane-anchored protein YjiN (DUF445 family)